MALEGVRVGPLDPDRAEGFGTVDGSTSARQLIRHHLAMYPPQLVRVLRLPRHGLRSDALDREEVEEAVEQGFEGDLPDEFEVTGYAVRGDEAAREKWLTYTWVGKSGRSGKGAIPYDEDALPDSFAAGTEKVQMDEAKKAGMPWIPSATAEALGRGDAVQMDADAEKTRAALDEERRLREEAEARAADLQTQLDAARADASRQSDSGITSGPQSPEGSNDPAGEGDESELPWASYDDETADVIAGKLREDGTPELAEKVRAYETGAAGSNRATVTRAADQILDRTPAE